MTFSELILDARYRLHDIRDNSGSIITDSSKDGIRWTSVLLQQISKSALTEMSRTLLAFGLKPYINNSYRTKKVNVTIDTDVSTGVSTVSNLPSGTYKILRIQVAAHPEDIYKELTPEEFASRRYLTTSDDDGDYIDKKGFFRYYDEVSLELITEVTPAISGSMGAEAFLYYGLENQFVITNADDLPFMDINDLMLDFIEKEARIREHNPQQVKEMETSIMTKLKELQIEIQTDNR